MKFMEEWGVGCLDFGGDPGSVVDRGSFSSFLCH